ncbi:MAG: hypothetical protein O3A77_04055, partial [bacterium]|nr:hypothetical protein [bacterium]
MVVEGPIPGLGVRMVDRTPIVSEAIAVDAGRLGQVIATEQTQGRNPMAFIDPDAAEVVSLVNDWQASGYVQTGMTESEIMTAVHRYVADKIQYQSDVGDQWQTVAQTLARGAGDCEDMAILVASLTARALHAVGMDAVAATVRLEAGLMADGSVGHMVARVGEQWVVDATQAVAIQDRAAVAMDSVYVLGMNGVQQTGRLDQVALLKRVGTAVSEIEFDKILGWDADLYSTQNNNYKSYLEAYNEISPDDSIRTAYESVETKITLKFLDDDAYDVNHHWQKPDGYNKNDYVFDFESEEHSPFQALREEAAHYNLTKPHLLGLDMGEAYYIGGNRLLTKLEVARLTIQEDLSLTLGEVGSSTEKVLMFRYYMPDYVGLDDDVGRMQTKLNEKISELGSIKSVIVMPKMNQPGGGFDGKDSLFYATFIFGLDNVDYLKSIKDDYALNEAQFNSRKELLKQMKTTGVINDFNDLGISIEQIKEFLLKRIPSNNKLSHLINGDGSLKIKLNSSNKNIFQEYHPNLVNNLPHNLYDSYEKMMSYALQGVEPDEYDPTIDVINQLYSITGGEAKTLKNYILGVKKYSLDYSDNPYEIVKKLHHNDIFRSELDNGLKQNGLDLDYTASSISRAAVFAKFGDTTISGNGEITETGYKIYKQLSTLTSANTDKIAKAVFDLGWNLVRSPNRSEFVKMLATILHGSADALNAVFIQGTNKIADDAEHAILKVALELAKTKTNSSPYEYDKIKAIMELMVEIVDSLSAESFEKALNFNSLDDNNQYSNDRDAIWPFFFKRLNSMKPNGITILEVTKASLQTQIAGYVSSVYDSDSLYYSVGAVDYHFSVLQSQDFIDALNSISDDDSVQQRLSTLGSISNLLLNSNTAVRSDLIISQDEGVFGSSDILKIRALANSQNFEISQVNAKKAIFLGAFRYLTDDNSSLLSQLSELQINSLIDDSIDSVRSISGLTSTQWDAVGVDDAFKQLFLDYISAIIHEFKFSLTDFGDSFESGVGLSDISNYLNSVVPGVISNTATGQFDYAGTVFLSNDVIDTLNFVWTGRTTEISDPSIANLLDAQLFSKGDGGQYSLTEAGRVFGAALVASDNSFDFKKITYSETSDVGTVSALSVWNSIEDKSILDEQFFDKYFFTIGDTIIQKGEIDNSELEILSESVRSFVNDINENNENVFTTGQKSGFLNAYDATKDLQLIKNDVDPVQFKSHLKIRSLTDE